MEKQKNSKKKKSTTEVDLVAVQIYADLCHTKLSSALSFIFAWFVGLSVLFYTVLYQNIGPNPVVTWGGGVILTIISTFAFLALSFRDYNKNRQQIKDLLNAIRAGKELPDTIEPEPLFSYHLLKRKK